MIADIDKRIRRALGNIRLSFRGVLTLVKSAGAVQLVQLDGLAGERLQDAELFQDYGYTSNPPAGTMAIVLPIGGKTAHGIIVATEHGGFRFKNLKSGEVAIYTDEGDSIILKRGRLVEVTTQTLRVNATSLVEFNTAKVQMNAPLVATTGEIKADLDITDHNATQPKTMAGMRQTYDTHTHSDPQGGSVGTPSVQM